MFRKPLYLDYERPHQHLCGRHSSSPEDYLTIIALPKGNRYGYQGNPEADKTGSTIKTEKEKFQVNLDVQHFAPEELSVRTADGFLIVEAKHDERRDQHGFVSRSFTRKYSLPESVDADSVTSKLSSDGVLTITAPLKSSNTLNERIVPTMLTGPVRQSASNQD